MISALMKPRAMSVWILAAASTAEVPWCVVWVHVSEAIQCLPCNKQADT